MIAKLANLSRGRLAWVLVLGLSAAGCSLFKTARPPPPAPPPPAAAVAPQLPKPSATDRFELTPEGGDIVGYVQKTTIGTDDTLSDIARRFDVGYDELVVANPGVDPWIPGVGREVIVPTQFVLPAAPHEGVVVNLAAMRIFYYPSHKKGEPQVVYTHPIGIGRVGWRTPEGTTRIVAREKDPVWVVPASVRKEHAEDGDKLPAVVPAGPDNPLGAYAFRLSWPSYLIHGTNKPYGVGMRTSHGCMRLYPEDIAEFFDMIPIGTKVTVVDQPYLFGWRDGALYLQAYAVMEDDSRDWNKNRKRLLTNLMNPKQRAKIGHRIEGQDKDIDWQRVGDLAHTPRAVPVPVTGATGGLDEVLSKSLLVENTVPTGSNWDGKSGLLVDEKTYNEMISGKVDRSPAATPASAAGGAGTGTAGGAGTGTAGGAGTGAAGGAGASAAAAAAPRSAAGAPPSTGTL
ncbi:MAG TPA: L,D-transpeptidase family protein [Steroidobacteraceae bacterium]|nr:L,D-transpeptidase family protein [Steroidobacteraceae bacterium]